jgi:hypothetical protein
MKHSSYKRDCPHFFRINTFRWSQHRHHHLHRAGCRHHQHRRRLHHPMSYPGVWIGSTNYIQHRWTVGFVRGTRVVESTCTCSILVCYNPIPNFNPKILSAVSMRCRTTMKRRRRRIMPRLPPPRMMIMTAWTPLDTYV